MSADSAEMRKNMQKEKFLSAVLVICLGAAAGAPMQAQSGSKDDVAAAVARMARVGSSFGAEFSPDGKWVSFISNMSGSPQVWIVPTEGGYPRMVTNGEDPVTLQDWSPASDWIAF